MNEMVKPLGKEQSNDKQKAPMIQAISVSDVHINEDCDRVKFNNISLTDDKETRKKEKVPRRILHFSDGLLEEYSTEEEEPAVPEPAIDPKTLKWIPWFWHYMLTSARQALNTADFCGEKLAWFFGITSPKYQYAIDEYNKLKAEEEREQKELEHKKEAKNLEVAKAMSDMEGASSQEEFICVKNEELTISTVGLNTQKSDQRY